MLQPIKGFVRNYRFKNKVLPLALTGACAIIAFIVYSLSPDNDTAVSLIFVSLIPIFAICGFDGRIPVGYAILLLILAAGIPRFGLPLALFSFWLLVVGVSCLLIGLLRNKLIEK